MRKIIVGAFVSVDGVMQAPGGPQEDPSGGFRYGGWLVPHFDDMLGQKIDEMFDRPFDLLLGRKTYDIFAAHWPHAGKDEPIGILFGKVTKYVATRNGGLALDWENSRNLGADVVGALRAMKREDGPDLLTQGSTELLQTLLQQDLVDEMQIMTFPVLLGAGKKLFGNGAAPTALQLVDSAVSTKGVIISRYARDGAVSTGSFAAAEPSQAELDRRANLV